VRKTHPGYNRRWLWVFIVFLATGILVALYFMAIAWFVPSPMAHDPVERALNGLSRASSFYRGLIFVLFFGFLIILLLRQLNVEKRYEQKRQLAAQGDLETVHLADEQIVPNNELPLLPLRLQNRLPFFISCVFIGFAVIIAILLAVLIVADIYAPSQFIIFTSPLAIGMIALIVGTVSAAIVPNTLTITETGIISTGWMRRQSVSWQHATLFALPNDSIFGNSPKCFALSSVKTIVSWRYVSPPGRHARIPSIPREEYNRTIDLINGYVVARTGLPLYDLRDRPPA
jgi:hypothetical protein